MQDGMTCMKRPKCMYEMSKKEVEKNEEVLFTKWLSSTDGTVEEWINMAKEHSSAIHANEMSNTGSGDHMPFSPTIFERNLEVWRQLYVPHVLSSTLVYDIILEVESG